MWHRSKKRTGTNIAAVFGRLALTILKQETTVKKTSLGGQRVEQIPAGWKNPAVQYSYAVNYNTIDWRALRYNHASASECYLRQQAQSTITSMTQSETAANLRARIIALVREFVCHTHIANLF